MCDFKPGDEVVCVIAGDLPFGSGELPAKGLADGAAYTIAAVAMCPYDNVPLVFLKETANADEGGRDYGYLPMRFRKVQRLKTDLSIEDFLTIKPGFEEPKRVTEPKPKHQNA